MSEGLKAPAPVAESMQACKPGMQAPSNLAGFKTKIPTFFG